MKEQILHILLLSCCCLPAALLPGQRHHKDLLVQEIRFLPEGGFFSRGVEVSLSHPHPEARIYYTLDGSEPNSRSRRFFKTPISLSKTTVIRAIAYSGADSCRMESATYFIDEPHTDWATVSLAIPPKMLFDTVSGIFELGVNNETKGLANYGANYWTRKEYRMNMEIFESDSACVYRSPCGFRLFGGMSRTFPQKSIAVASRLRYGNKRFRHRIFPSQKVKRYKHLILRNAGSDWNHAHGRDAIINSMVDDWGLDKQAYRPCHVYLNGGYFGVYYLREKINAYFIATHHKGVSPDSLDLVEHKEALRKGSRGSYDAMLKFMKESDMRVSKNYKFLQTMMNVENFADYKLLQIFIDNVDAGGNIKFWRSDNYDNGRWNWILYDTDWGFSLMQYNAYEENSFDFHTRPDGPDWPNPPWSTFILRTLLENRDFRHLFLNRFCDRLNTSFRTDSMLSKIQAHHALMAPEMPRQFERWGSNERIWNIHYNRMVRFAERRPDVIWEQLAERFDTGKRVRVEVSAKGRGSIRINDNIKVTYRRPFKGHYFQKVPIQLHATPRLGYEFSHWENTGETSPSILVNLMGRDSLHYRAIFAPLNTELKDSILFNEVSIYNKQTGDWIELHNTTHSNINLEGWIVKNRKKEYSLPPHWLGPLDYVVLARDTTRFLQAYPMYRNKLLGDFNFGLDKSKDRLELYNRKGATVDTFSYHIATPGSDFTIDLKSPYFDNADSSNWEVHYGRGTPNAMNPSYIFMLVRAEQARWVVVGLVLGGGLVIGVGCRTVRRE